MKRPSLAKKFGGEEEIPAAQLLTQLVNEANRNGRFDNDRGGRVDLPRLWATARTLDVSNRLVATS